MMEWLRQVSKIAISSGKVLRWTSPVGFRVYQGYKNTKRKDVTTALGETLRYCSYQEPQAEMSIRKNNRALPANFVHSIDSGLMMLTTLEAFSSGVRSFSMVHDSFATHAADAETLSRSLRKSASQIFAKNLLADFRDEIQSLVPEQELPDIPTQGKLEPTDLKEAEYFFS